MVEITKVDYDRQDDLLTIEAKISAKADIVVKIEDGDWVNDKPNSDWFLGDDKGIWHTDEYSDVPGIFLCDEETVYEYTCEDLVNAPELEGLDDGLYRVTADVELKFRVENIYVSHFMEYDKEANPKDASGFEDVDSIIYTLSVSTDNINVERIR